jgi:26S proteasome regulatory subunit N10
MLLCSLTMPDKEAIMICVDNSEYMRNGDYAPTRMVAQIETVNNLANFKLNSNQETSVGLLSMSGRRVELLASPSRKLHLISTALGNLQIGHQCQFMDALRTAQLALKNRPNKDQLQRIVVFVGSPLEVDQKRFIKLGKELKKNCIAVDVINFGTENTTNENTTKLEAFIAAVDKKGSNSHLVNLPAGREMSNVVLTSSIIVPGGGGSSGGVAAAPVRVGGSTVQEDEDRDFQMAMRMSLEENRQRQEKAVQDAIAASAPQQEANASTTPMDVEEDDEEEDDEYDEEEFARALAMSMAPTRAKEAEVKQTEEVKTEAMVTAPDEGAEDNEDNLDALEDPDFIRSLLDGPVEDGDITDILNQLNQEGEDDQYTVHFLISSVSRL